jgi:uncharacterized protein (DUF2235 family)
MALEERGVMARNLVVCFDGTDNQFGKEYSNVIRIIQSLDRDPALQSLHYQPGIGTLPDPTFWNPWNKLKTKIGNLADRVMAWRLEHNVEDAYAYLMNYWEPDDNVYIFGFSRGAYTARVLAGLLYAVGLIPKGDLELVPYVMRIYKSIRDTPEGKKAKQEYLDLCDKFRQTFSRQTADPDRRFPVHFLGVWDTVSSAGWFWNASAFPFTTHNPGIAIIRHAVSIDEKRIFYRQNLFERMGTQDFDQQWFAGDHSDIGGGYAEQMGGLWRVTFEWMVSAATTAGLTFDEQRLRGVRNQSTIPDKPWAEPVHDRLAGMWWLAEILRRRNFPKDTPKDRRLPHSRYIRDQQLINPSVLERVRETDYRPPNFSPFFIEQIQRLEDIVKPVHYEWGPALATPQPSKCTEPVRTEDIEHVTSKGEE